MLLKNAIGKIRSEVDEVYQFCIMPVIVIALAIGTDEMLSACKYLTDKSVSQAILIRIFPIKDL